MIKYFKTRGPMGMLRGALSRVNQFVPGSMTWAITGLDQVAMNSEAWFDRRYNVQTSGRILPTTYTNDQLTGRGELIWYEPCSLKHLRTAISAIPLKRDETYFIDIGSGLGRVPLYASLQGFKCSIGIELDGALFEHSLRNLQTFHAPSRSPVSFLNFDAINYKFPSDANLAIFLFTPFTGRAFEAFIDSLGKQKVDVPHEWLVLYYGNNAENLKVLREAFSGEVAIKLPLEYSRPVQYQLHMYRA
jgi:hypothetical protein